MIKGIIFDYGGTIDSRADHWSHIINSGWHEARLDVPQNIFRDAYVYAERELARNRHIMPCDNFLELLRKKIRIEMSWMAEKKFIAADEIEGYAEPIARYCYDYARECVDEARPVLRRLAERYPMVLVSNFYGNIDEVLRDFDIRQYFKGIIESSVVGIRKPDSRIFMLGVIALDLKPDEVLVVGDSLQKDILPARSIGCRTAWLKGRGWTAADDLACDEAEIKSLGDLLGLLDGAGA